MRTKLVAIIAAAALAAPLAAVAADGPWMLRVRAVNLDMKNASDPIPALGVPPDAIHVSDKTIPEVDISYFFTRNLAAELILTVPQKHNVTLSGGAIGSFKHLPPTLTLQCHFMPEATFRPYVGAGLNYTKISSVNLNVAPVGALQLEDHSVGLAAQAGFDVKLGERMFLNFDLKKIQIRSDVLASGAKVSAVKLDPWALGVGLGWRF